MVCFAPWIPPVTINNTPLQPVSFELPHENPSSLGFRPGPTQTSQRSRLQTWNFAYKKKMNGSILVGKTKVLISCAVTVQLICRIFSHLQIICFHMRRLIFQNDIYLLILFYEFNLKQFFVIILIFFFRVCFRQRTSDDCGYHGNRLCEDLYYSVDVTGNLELVIVIHIFGL